MKINWKNIFIGLVTGIFLTFIGFILVILGSSYAGTGVDGNFLIGLILIILGISLAFCILFFNTMKKKMALFSSIIFIVILFGSTIFVAIGIIEGRSYHHIGAGFSCEINYSNDSENTISWRIKSVSGEIISWDECKSQLIYDSNGTEDLNAVFNYNDLDNDGKVSVDDTFIVIASSDDIYQIRLIDNSDCIAFLSQSVQY